MDQMLDNMVVYHNCGHVVHSYCAEPWKKKKQCPTCNTKGKFRPLYYKIDESEVDLCREVSESAMTKGGEEEGEKEGENLLELLGFCEKTTGEVTSEETVKVKQEIFDDDDESDEMEDNEDNEDEEETEVKKYADVNNYVSEYGFDAEEREFSALPMSTGGEKNEIHDDTVVRAQRADYFETRFANQGDSAVVVNDDVVGEVEVKIENNSDNDTALETILAGPMDNENDAPPLPPPTDNENDNDDVEKTLQRSRKRQKRIRKQQREQDKKIARLFETVKKVSVKPSLQTKIVKLRIKSISETNNVRRLSERAVRTKNEERSDNYYCYASSLRSCS